MKFYRFQAINKLTLQNLSNRKNWVADPYEFNDPFEFSLIDRFYHTTEGVPQQLEGAELKSLNRIEEQIKEFGVVCYSSDFYNNLLWAHYAENHKGMCLVFDVPEEKKSDLHKVNYQKEFPRIDLTQDADAPETLKKVVATKSKDWEYENEYREVFLMKNMLHAYPGELVEIIFGCRTPFDDIKIAVDVAVSKNPNITISKMRIARNEYGLGKETHGTNKEVPHIWRLDLKI